jgi:hypothetical protein
MVPDKITDIPAIFGIVKKYDRLSRKIRPEINVCFFV